ncbi:MAG: glycerol-3-phosphate acyltransferase [Candidatus Hodarchaeota archaeon]
MDPYTLFVNILSPVIGYLVGSILPAYILVRVIKKIDIREQGTGIAGTMNAFRTLGKAYAIPTAIFDTLKGVGVIFLAEYILKAEYFFAHLSGLAAIAGHVFPFYIRFKGGRGLACATGILIRYMIEYLIVGFEMLFFFFYMVLIIMIFVYVSRTGKILGAIVLPLIGYTVFVYYPNVEYNLFFWIILAYIFSFCIYHIIKDKKLRIEDETFKSHWWRVIIRPVALLFLVFYIYYSKEMALIVIGIVGLCFIALDLIRFLHRQANVLFTEKIKKIFRKDEKKKFSTMTIFLIGFFVTILLFEMTIAIIAIIYLTFCDMFGKVFGLAFGKHKLFHKTVEGSLSFFGCVLICGYIMFASFNYPLILLLWGGITATITEFLPLGVDDNFTVPILSGAVMTVITIFIS